MYRSNDKPEYKPHHLDMDRVNESKEPFMQLDGQRKTSLERITKPKMAYDNKIISRSVLGKTTDFQHVKD